MTNIEFIQLTINDTVVCINDEYIENFIRINNQYVVNSKDILYSSIRIINDNGDSCQFNYNRFELITKIRIEKMNKILK